MANTYTQIHIQAVFAVQDRMSLVSGNWKDELYKYITGIIQSYDHKLLQINGMPDHIHILFGMRPTQSLSDLMQLVKQDSSKWVNKRGFVKGKFAWQSGYGAFSYSKKELVPVIKYIQNQEQHHKTESFEKEYQLLLKDFEIEYDDRFVLKPIL